MTSETAYLNGGSNPHHHHNNNNNNNNQLLKPPHNEASFQSSSSSSSPSPNSSLNTTNSSTRSSTGNNNDDQTIAQIHHDLIYDPNVKYPLENSWSFWFYKGEKTKTWKENVKFITTVDYVEDFWAVYNHLQLVSKINVGCDYMFFKKDVPPMWEDPQNLDGGLWKLGLDKKYHNSCLDTYWLNILLALIGDQFCDEGPYVNGVWVNVRAKIDKISLWTKAAKNADVQMKIGNRFREILSIREKEQLLTYEEHGASEKGGSGELYKI